jgi:glyoxylase-like metal-dependent hydrolase (beta-lactamase superfamily II)
MTDGTRALLPLPPVEQVRPGLWSIPVPMPNNSLRYVFVYVFETHRGLYLVDVGWNTDDAYDALRDGLAQMGASIDDVSGMLVTHIHPDHYGLAGRVREASGAWIALHPADAALIHDRYEEPENLLDRVEAMLRRVGAPEDEVPTLTSASMPARSLVGIARPDVLLEDGDKPEVGEWDLTAIWTPGHSPGHLCFWEGRRQLMLSGDHVLPRITPNIPYHPQAGADPLGDFLESLDKLRPYSPAEVLPAHEHRFVGLHQRLDGLRAHHEQRFAEAVAAIEDGVTTGWGIAQRLQWSRPWNRIEGFMKRAAVAEALAHLRALEGQGRVREVVGAPSRWEITEPRQSADGAGASVRNGTDGTKLDGTDEAYSR